MDIEGNELVDRLAKEAALDPGVPKPPDLTLLRTTVKRTLKTNFKARWAQYWQNGRFGRRLFDLIQAPYRSTLKLYENLPRVISSTIIRARTGSIPLKAYLGSIRLSPTTECACQEGHETVKHLVLNCPMYTALRTRIWGTQHPWNLKEELSTATKATKVATFLIRIGALGLQWDAQNIA